MKPGAIFRKADLHLHAPGKGQRFVVGESRDVETPAGRAAFAREYVRRAREAGLDIIAITNHNDTRWIDPIRQAAQELQQEIGSLFVFPGVEIGTDSGRDGVHVLALFDIDTPVERVEEFLLAVGLRSDQRFNNAGCPCCSALSFPQVLEKVKEFEGVAIAPHPFSENGLLDSQKGELRKRDFADPRLLAVDLKKPKEECTTFEQHVLNNTHRDPQFRRPRPIACLNSSDARSLDEIGAWYTWIKCEEVNLESLRQALLDHESRLRLRDDPPPGPPFVITSVAVADTPTGFLRGLTLELNERMNCLIGGRGTGKSAVIELLRYVWEQDPMPPRRKDFEAFLPVFFPETASVVVEILDRSIPGRQVAYRLKREGRSPTQVYLLENGKEIPKPGLSPHHLFRLDVYGQKEVLYTSEDIHSQLELLDRMIGEPVERLNHEEGDILLRLKQNREQIIGWQRQVEQLQGRLDRLPYVRRRLEEIQSTGLGEKAEIRRAYEEESRLWQTTLERLNRLVDTLQQQTNLRLDLEHLAEENISLLPSASKLFALRDRLSALQARMDKALGKILADVQKTQEQVKSVQGDWVITYQSFEMEYRQQLATLELGPDFQPDEILCLERERGELEQLQSQVRDIQQRICSLLEQRNEDLKSLLDVRQRRFGKRQEKAEDITNRLRPQQPGIPPRVRVSVSRAGDREALLEQLKVALSGSRLRERDYQAIADRVGGDILGMLAQIEQADRNVEQGMKAFVQWLPEATELQPMLNITPADPLEVLTNALRLDDASKAGKVVEYLGWEQRLEMAEFGVPDKVTIEVNVASEGDPIWRALGHRIGEGVSVGQGCTAILSIILLEAGYPLIIDQPEDDLDNRFIYDEVVQILRRERGRRQMLIATHNPNIPVSGDAELIIALSTEETEHLGRRDLRCKVEAQGFIDRQEIRRQVSQILEGGEQAFEMRRQKYGF